MKDFICGNQVFNVKISNLRVYIQQSGLTHNKNGLGDNAIFKIRME